MRRDGRLTWTCMKTLTDKKHIFHFQILRKSFFIIMKGFIVYPGNITLGFRPFYQKYIVTTATSKRKFCFIHLIHLGTSVVHYYKFLWST